MLRVLAVFTEELLLMLDRVLNATLSEKVSTTRVTEWNLELPLSPSSLDSH